MGKLNTISDNAITLRQKAEQLVAARKKNTKNTSNKEMDGLKLIHELEVHQVELEMQMEELLMAKEKAELAEDKYSQLYDFAPSGYLSLTKDGTISELNFTAANLLGKDRSNLINRVFALYVSEQTRPDFNHFINKVFENESKQSCEVIIEPENNNPIYVYIDGTICQNGLFCVMNLIDISERKRTEFALIQSEERYKRITSDLTDYLYSVKIRNGKAEETIHDETCLIVTGYTSQEFTENPNLWYNIIFPDDRQSVIDTIAEITQSRKSLIVEHRIICKNNQIRWIKNVLIPKFNADNELISYDGVIKDISEIKNAYQALKESETKCKEIINQINDGIVVFDEQEKIVIWNKGAEQLFGIDANEAIDRNIVDVQYQFSSPRFRDKALIQEKIREIITLRTPAVFGQIIDYETVNISGKIQNNQCTIFPIKLESSNLFSTVIRDTTEKKEYEKMLVQLNADKDRFLTILAHDLRSPFSAIIGYLDLLTENLHEYEIGKIEKFLGIINHAANNTYQLLDDILMWVRANSGKIPYEPQTLNFGATCNEILENLQLNAKSKNITINQLASEDISVFADKNMLQTILRNLISNAIKFTNPSGKIVINAEKTGTNTTVTVSDNGVGIGPDTKSKLFDITHATSTSGTANEPGTGLGLMLCKEFVEKHGCKIWVESESGKGSDFIFTMPLPPTTISTM